MTPEPIEVGTPTDVERINEAFRKHYLEPVMATIREIAANASPEMLALVPALKEVRDQLPEPAVTD